MSQFVARICRPVLRQGLQFQKVGIPLVTSVNHNYMTDASKVHPKLNGTREEFIQWLKTLHETGKEGKQYVELYHYLLNAFVVNDNNYDGTIDPSEFDHMIQKTSYQPRAYGLAPTEEDLFKGSESARYEYRKKLFKEIDKNGDGEVTFDEVLAYFYAHITGFVMEKLKEAGK